MEIEKIAAESPESLDEFGLNGPRLRVTLKARSDEYSVSVGSETPLGSGIYVKVDGEGRIVEYSRASAHPEETQRVHISKKEKHQQIKYKRTT